MYLGGLGKPARMLALLLNATLKRSPERSSTGALLDYTAGRLREHEVDVEQIRLADHSIEPGVISEALNEHILGIHWPEADVRLEMLEEAVAVIRGLWDGAQYSHRGRHCTVENARLYSLPEQPPPIYVSGFGTKAIDLAGRIGDGYCSVMPDAGMVERFRAGGGAGKTVQGGTKVCWGPDRDECVRTVRRLWPNEALKGELAQVLPTPAHFEQATALVSDELIADTVPCGPDAKAIDAAFQAFADAGYDELYVQQIGNRQEAFFDLLRDELVPRFS